MTPLQKLLRNSDSTQKLLPFVHITDAYGMMGIIENGKLITYYCEVMKEELIYMFYGRPAYRSKYSGDVDLTANLPIALIFEPSELERNIKRIFPFDSGAFEGGLLDDFFHRRSEIADFELSGDIKNALALVDYFYGTNYHYMCGNANKNSSDIVAFNFDAEGLLSLANAKFPASKDGTPRLDQRCNAIELQFSEDLLLVDQIIHIIYPKIAMENESFRNFISQFKNTTLEGYDTIHGFDSSHVRSLFYEKIIKFYEKFGLFDPDNRKI